MGPLDRVRADDLRQIVEHYRDALRAHQEVLNRLNVYPVPDGDTGTNMALTLEAVLTELNGAADRDMAATCKALSHGSLMGARGNSGVILSQVLRGLADELQSLEEADGRALASALQSASAAAYEAVMRPVEGTILTVVRESASAAAAAADDDGDLAAVLDAARRAGEEALARTPELLPVLAEAGVVDAGGAGFLLLLDAALHVVEGRAMPEPSPGAQVRQGSAAEAAASSRAGPRYEVMYLLDAPDETIAGFKDAWAEIGDSIVVVGGDGLWNCHIHTDDIGAAVEAALGAGRPRNIRVSDLAEQVEEEAWVRAAEAEAPSVTTAVVAVGVGEGVGRILRSLGVQQVVAGGQSMNPSTAQILEAVGSVPADDVVVLPNNKNIVPVAEQVDGLTSKRVRVVPTVSIAEGFAALLAYDADVASDVNAAAMAEAAATVVTGEVTRAVRSTSSPAGPITEGDYLGLARDGVKVVDPTLVGAATALLDQLVADGHEVVTVIEGDGATEADTEQIVDWLARERPGVACEVHHGGQPLYPYYFGVE